MYICIADPNTSILQILKMQAFFITHSINSERIVQRQKQILDEKTSSLTKEIITSTVRCNEDRDKLFKKIVIDIIVHTSLGSPTNVKVWCMDTFHLKVIIFNLKIHIITFFIVDSRNSNSFTKCCIKK